MKILVINWNNDNIISEIKSFKKDATVCFYNYFKFLLALKQKLWTI